MRMRIGRNENMNFELVFHQLFCFAIIQIKSRPKGPRHNKEINSQVI